MDASTPHATNGGMNPNPMLMILGSMGQSRHGNTPYAGNLHGSYEFVPESREHALEWMRANRPSEKATLIEIRVLEILDPTAENGSAESCDGACSDCTCGSTSQSEAIIGLA